MLTSLILQVSIFSMKTYLFLKWSIIFYLNTNILIIMFSYSLCLFLNLYADKGKEIICLSESIGLLPAILTHRMSKYINF